MPDRQIKKLLVANRSEIAIRVMRAAAERDIETVAVYSEQDRLALHRFKADESYLIGEGRGPVEAYLSIDEMIRVAKEAGADAVHPGYGFLSERPDFVEACAEAGLTFVGPPAEVMKRLGNKVSARNLAIEAGVPVVPASDALPTDLDEVAVIAEKIGYPLMLKASWGGGGRGMRRIYTADELKGQVQAGRSEAKAAFGNDEVYLEKLVERARHVEVQLLGDSHGNVIHLYERDCSVQRRNQKVVERAPAPYLNEAQRQEVCNAALQLAEAASYQNAGTAEFLMDMETGAFYFIEVNPRIQVEHTVTEEVTGVDVVKAQLAVAEGAKIGDGFIPAQSDVHLNGHAMQCRITTEDPEQNFIPDHGRIQIYRGANGFGIRLDGGTAYSGALINRYYDSMLEKVTAWAPTQDECIKRMRRALGEFRIRGVQTNIAFLENLIDHKEFLALNYSTRFIDETPELFDFKPRKDRATRLLKFIGEVTVNGNPETKDAADTVSRAIVHAPRLETQTPPDGTKQLLDAMGPQKFAQWMRDEKRLLVTDTTMRDAHQSLLATRMRTNDIVAIAPYMAQAMPELFSVECWGGATFDVAMRFLHEDPWSRLHQLRDAMPNVLTQMLLRSANAVGYTNYPDNVVSYFIDRAADAGIDLFRVFDCLNVAENMVPAIEEVAKTGKLCEAAICYSGDLTNPAETKFTLDYYLGLAKQFEAAGAHIIGVKDMAGLCKPAAIRELVTALRQETDLPIHFHTHDTSGAAAASVLAASDAGVDAVDAAIDSMSGVTSQPNLGSIAAALRHQERDTGLDADALIAVTTYWEQVRKHYGPYESDIRAGTSDVYRHEIPGGQYTNLRQQAKAMGLDHRWPEVAGAYAAVNKLLGNIVKVTPSSKVVGDLALYMMSSGLTVEDVLDPDKDIAFPESVIQLLNGELGTPPGGFPDDITNRVLKGKTPLTGRPGAHLPPADLEAERAKAAEAVGRDMSDEDLAAYLMYPKVFTDFATHQMDNGDVEVLPTPVFFTGMDVGEEISVDIDKGKTLVIRCLGVSEADQEGYRRVFFELNGQPRQVKVLDTHLAAPAAERPKADAGNPNHVGAPMPGLVVQISVKPGDSVKAGDTLVALEAMKMQTSVTAERDGVIAELMVEPGITIDAKDLIMTFTDA
ncbi:MAG: pyruvate carboxylase [Alphaproteobacteria bacterium]|nr:pyruvate carboxylase [Alphaproteobacteria bacterium]